MYCDDTRCSTTPVLCSGAHTVTVHRRSPMQHRCTWPVAKCAGKCQIDGERDGKRGRRQTGRRQDTSTWRGHFSRGVAVDSYGKELGTALSSALRACHTQRGRRSSR